ncbi:MAG: maleylacetoacetate isomerase [Paraglaciecola sp.]|jgi:maleylacetoacetate isomerase
MKLFGYFRSTAAYRVRIALNYKELQYQHVGINLLQGEQHSDAYLALTPQGLVPILQMPDGTQISQSTAILEWLEEVYPNPALYPDDKLARATVRALTNTIACDIHPLNNLRVLKYLVADLNVDEAQKIKWYQHWIALGFAGIEAQLTGTSYCLGDKVSMADIYLIPQVYNALRFNQDMDDFPKITSIYQNCNEFKAFKDSAPEAQPDAK